MEKRYAAAQQVKVVTAKPGMGAMEWLATDARETTKEDWNFAGAEELVEGGRAQRSVGWALCVQADLEQAGWEVLVHVLVHVLVQVLVMMMMLVLVLVKRTSGEV